ncbi:MAG TPA: metal-dependent hydrolase [Flavobacterium sp.]|uniref:metal-dependent hydrolase n=1 Tax=unclassified Flavobacterium TaxID=196869 RepID=UPI000E93FC90|nr:MULTISPECIES: metal-dependent hydrolase [unclassified Flavobacterium]HBI02092.1 metal-dependent hydrolase [Flavobacterium sp.]HRE76942.1 metal-dependent hydrolase [Flavobacterium sp.]
MDSLSQIVLGAAVGNQVLGKKIGNKAILYGAIIGTMPDLDVLYGKFLDPLTATDIHRGFSHSTLFFLFLSPILGWILQKIEHKKGVNFKEATLFSFLILQTHALLDLFTTWGTQLFWPLENRFSLQSIFVIDPLYTLPFLLFLIFSIKKKKDDPKRMFWNRTGLIVSTSYLFLTLIVQSIVLQKFEKQLEQNKISYKEIVVKPSPFNIILWTTNIKVDNGYYIGDYSFFDTKPIQFQFIPKQNELITEYENEAVIKQLKRISEGWYCITQKENQLLFNDLRFGVMNADKNDMQFSFSYEITEENGEIKAKELPNKNRAQAKKLLGKLWVRLWGN